MNKTVCVFGDSITHGADDYGHGGWVGRLQKHFGTIDDWHIFYNLGVPENTSADVLDRFEQEFDAREPHIVIFAIGINDAQYVNSSKQFLVPQDEFIKNVNQLVSFCREKTKPILFVGLTPVNETYSAPPHWNPDREFRNKNIEQYNNALKEWSASQQLPFVDVFSSLNQNDIEEFDGVHPNASGHEKIFQRILPAVEKILAS